MARVLVIEDSQEHLDLMSYLLQAFGHTALRAADGEQGLETARRETPDLIVCDIHLPKIDGYEVARRLKRDPVLRSIPLVAVTALAMVGDRDKVLAAGFDGYLSKPIAPKRFVEQIEGYLAAPAHGGTTLQPSSRQPSPPPSRLVATVWHSRQAQVLVVDDSPPNRELIRQTLEAAGYETRLVGTVRDGLARARERPPDLILSDLHLPGEGGFDFVRQAKADARLAGVPFVILTSSIWADRDRATARQLGAVRFLTRPIAPATLLQEIAALVPPEGTGAARFPDS